MGEDVRMAEDIYGPSIPHLKGKIAWCRIQHVEPVKITSVPKTILDKYNEVTIFCDLMNINGLGFLNTISRHIMFSIGSIIKNRKNWEHCRWDHAGTYIIPAAWLQNHTYAHWLWVQTTTQGNDRSRHKTKPCIKKKHVPEIERFIRTVEERVKSARATMMFKQISNIIIVQLVTSPSFGLMHLPHQHLAQDCQTKKVSYNFSLEIWLTKKVLPPPARIICPGESIGWNPQHNFYRPDCRRNWPRNSI